MKNEAYRLEGQGPSAALLCPLCPLCHSIHDAPSFSSSQYIPHLARLGVCVISVISQVYKSLSATALRQNDLTFSTPSTSSPNFHLQTSGLQSRCPHSEPEESFPGPSHPPAALDPPDGVQKPNSPAREESFSHPDSSRFYGFQKEWFPRKNRHIFRTTSTFLEQDMMSNTSGLHMNKSTCESHERSWWFPMRTGVQNMLGCQGSI